MIDDIPPLSSFPTWASLRVQNSVLETGENVREAIPNLTVGLLKDPDVPVGWRTLARAHALAGDRAMAELATAEERFVIGNYEEARIHATRAQESLKPGTPPWLRADDILTYKPPKPL